MRRIVALTVVLSALACSGGGTEPTVEPISAVPTPDPTTTTATPPPVVAEPTAKDPTTPRLTAMSKEIQSEVAAIKADVSNAKTAKDLHAAWVRADTFAPQLEAVLEGWGGQETMCYDLVLDALDTDLGVMSIGCEGEGTIPVVDFPTDPWKAAAAKTPEAEDDAFFDLTAMVYSQGRVGTWPIWIQGMWDYGGCSELGHATIVHDALLAVDKATAAGTLWAEPVAKVRADLFSDNLSAEHDQYCNAGPPTADSELVREVDLIVKDAKLTDAEKQQIEALRPLLKGEEFSGG